MDGLRADEVYILWRDASGFTKSTRAIDCGFVEEHMKNGALLGALDRGAFFGWGPTAISSMRKHPVMTQMCVTVSLDKEKFHGGIRSRWVRS